MPRRDAATPQPPDTSSVVHASCVCVGDKAVLIRGASGTGKSGLALQLIAYGAVLVSDDRTQLFRQGAAVYADAPDTIRGMIEARHVGLLQTLCSGPVKLVLIVDMDCQETDRLPPQRQETLLGVALPVVRKSVLPHFPAAILTYLKGGRVA